MHSFYVCIYTGKKIEEFKFYKKIYENINFFLFIDSPLTDYENTFENIFKKIRESPVHTIYFILIQEIENEENLKEFITEFKKIKGLIDSYIEKGIRYSIYILPFLKINFDFEFKNQFENYFIFKNLKRNGIRYEDMEWFKDLFEYFYLLSLNEKERKISHFPDILPIQSKGTFAIKKIEFEKFTLIKKNLFNYFKEWIQRKNKIPEFDGFEKDFEEFQNLLLKEMEFPCDKNFEEVINLIENINITKIKKDKTYFKEYKNSIVEKIKKFENEVNNYKKYIEEEKRNFFEEKYKGFLEKINIRKLIIEKLRGYSFEEVICSLKEMLNKNLKECELPEIKIIENIKEIFDKYEKSIEDKLKEVSQLKIWEKILFFIFYLIIFGILIYFFKIFIKNFFFSFIVPAIFSLIFSYLLKNLSVGKLIKTIYKKIEKLYMDLKNELKKEFENKAKEKFSRQIKMYVFKNYSQNFLEFYKSLIQKEIEYLSNIKEKLNKILNSFEEKHLNNLNYKIKEKIEKIIWLDLIKIEEVCNMDEEFLKRKIEFALLEKAKELFKESPDYNINLALCNENVIKGKLTLLCDNGIFNFIVIKHQKTPSLNFQTLATFLNDNIMGMNIYVIHFSKIKDNLSL